MADLPDNTVRRVGWLRVLHDGVVVQGSKRRWRHEMHSMDELTAFQQGPMDRGEAVRLMRKGRWTGAANFLAAMMVFDP